jgi:GTPase SAR1 family protein
VFDLCSKESFLNLGSWLKEVEKHSGEDVSIMVLANKSDAAQDEVEVSEADIKKFEEDSGLKVLRTSAKTGANVDESFLEMTKRLIVKKNNSGQDDKKKSLGLQKLKQTIEGGQQPPASQTSFCCQ